MEPKTFLNAAFKFAESPVTGQRQSNLSRAGSIIPEFTVTRIRHVSGVGNATLRYFDAQVGTQVIVVVAFVDEPSHVHGQIRFDEERRVIGVIRHFLQFHVDIMKNQILSFPKEMRCGMTFSVSIGYFPSGSKRLLHFLLVEKLFHGSHEPFSTQGL